jgi:hypothetical protein
MHLRHKKSNNVSIGHPEGKRPLERPRRTYNDKVKMDRIPYLEVSFLDA